MSKVTEYLQQHHVPFTTLGHAAAASAVAEAYVLVLPPWKVAKTVVLDTSKGHVIAVVPADRRVDLPRVRAALGDPHATLADEAEIARDYPEFELGAIPPIGRLTGTTTLVDPEIAGLETIVFASGRQDESVRIATGDLLDDANVRVLPIVVAPTFEDDWLQ
ncbi:MAG TPA: YbaK/EbsC family protein [Actinomycetota bacterium]|nr:YbaK/EbsC family protein [Actinomycetota bacterium]